MPKEIGIGEGLYRLVRKKYQKNLSMNSSKKYFILLLAFNPSICSWYHQRILKNSHFENMTAGFLLRCQNSLWQTTSEIMHIQGWQK